MIVTEIMKSIRGSALRSTIMMVAKTLRGVINVCSIQHGGGINFSYIRQ